MKHKTLQLTCIIFMMSVILMMQSCLTLTTKRKEITNLINKDNFKKSKNKNKIGESKIFH